MSLNIFGLSFHLYGLILGLSILAALQSSLWLAEKRGVDKKTIEKLFWWVIIGGIIGARVYHVIDKWKEIYSLNPQSVFYLWNGGLGIWGAVVGGIAGLWLGKRFLHFGRNDKICDIKLIELLDVVLFGMPLGQAIGRWGNFFNNEIVGKNGEPLFLYESVLDLVLFGILVLLVSAKGGSAFGRKLDKKPGKIAGVYLVGYGLIRFLLEPLRPESIVWKVAGVPTASIISVMAVLTGISLIYWRRQS